MALPIPPPADLLARLNREHPRLLASAETFSRLRQQVTADEQPAQWVAQLRDRARGLFQEPPSRYEIPDGVRLLATSRRVLDRIYTLGLIYRLEGDRRYAERAWQELHAAAGFPDWNPRHFLDTAEMTHAFAIGYDWFHDVWDEGQRAALRRAMVEKGLQLAQAAYRSEERPGWWARWRFNWNQVCNGGIGMGALALADEEPELAGEILHAALQSIQIPMEGYGPDGAWEEGPGYWHYATSYNVLFLAALESALGTDFGLAQIPGFSETGLFPLYVTGPLGRTFNYADGGDNPIRAPEMFWLARKFDRPVLAWYQRRRAAPDARDLLWYDARGEGPRAEGLPLDRHFRRAEVATFRSAWEDDDALFVGFKAGDNKASHSNLDLGSFILDALGVRWALDLGRDNYNMPGYFGRQRWTYYRMRAEGHNTLVLNPHLGADQDPTAAASILRFASAPERAFAIADLTPAYAQHAYRVWRGIALLDRQMVLVQDEVEAAEAAELWWFLHTGAEAQVGEDRRMATLTQGTARLWARILSPAEAGFTVMDAQPLPSSPHPEEQARNEGIRKLAIQLRDVTAERLAVLLVPLADGEEPPGDLPEVSPLEEW